jgi:mRNA-degrading endonuclease RelE of RelBE toxin-antitoxin system
LAIEEIVIPDSVKKDLRELPAQIRHKFYEQLERCLQNPSHPSLRIHQLRSRPGIKSLSITMKYRATFYVEGSRLIIEAVGTHEIYR